MGHRLVLVSGLVLMLAMLGGCGSDSGSVQEPGDLNGTSWTVVAIRGLPVPDGMKVTAAFDEGKVNGQAACNGYFAGYEQNGTTLTFSELGGTRKMSDEPAMAEEKRFMEAFELVRFGELDGDALILRGGAKEMLVILKPA